MQPAGEFRASKTKQIQAKLLGFSWFYLVLFGGIGTFQWVTGEKTKKFFPSADSRRRLCSTPLRPPRRGHRWRHPPRSVSCLLFENTRPIILLLSSIFSPAGACPPTGGCPRLRQTQRQSAPGEAPACAAGENVATAVPRFAMVRERARPAAQARYWSLPRPARRRRDSARADCARRTVRLSRLAFGDPTKTGLDSFDFAGFLNRKPVSAFRQSCSANGASEDV